MDKLAKLAKLARATETPWRWMEISRFRTCQNRHGHDGRLCLCHDFSHLIDAFEDVDLLLLPLSIKHHRPVKRSNGQRVKAREHRWGEHTEHTEHTKQNHRTFFKKNHEMNMAEGEIPLCKCFFSRCPWPDHHPPAPSHSDRSWSPILRPVDDESVTDPVGLRGVVAADL